MITAQESIKKITKTSLFLLFLSFNYLAFSKNIYADTVNSISAIPPRLEISAKPNGVASKIIKVRNESSENKSVQVSIRDFIVTDNKGTPTVVEDSEKNNRWAASAWIQVSPSTVQLKPGETKSLTLTIMPPKDALPGGHYAMVVYSPNQNVTFSMEGTGSSVQTNVGTLIYVTIPGDITQNAKIINFSAPSFSEFGPVDFKTTIKNLSDIHIAPKGQITITNMFGLKTANLDLENINIFPNLSRNYQNTLQKKWLFGRYKAEISAAYGTAGGVLTGAVFFWVIPWRLLILVGTAIAIIVVIILVIKNQPKKDNNDQDKVDELEKELEDLKKKYKDQ